MRTFLRKKTAVITGALILLSGCATTNWQELSVAEANAELEGSYVLTRGDALRISVFDEPSLTGEFVIGEAGNIAYPLLDTVQASGQTTESLSASIGQDLSEYGYVLNPRVSVEVMSYRPIYVLGEVREPGEYDYVEQLTALQAIAKAGGFTPLADQRRIVLQRSGWQERRAVQLREVPLMVAPGDTILITASPF